MNPEHPLAPARGIIIGITISALLWTLIWWIWL